MSGWVGEIVSGWVGGGGISPRLDVMTNMAAVSRHQRTMTG